VVCVRCGPGAILDLREIRLAQTAADSLFIAEASSCWVIERPNPRSEPSDGAEGAEFLAKFHRGLAYCNLQIIYYILLFCQAKSDDPSMILYAIEFK